MFLNLNSEKLQHVPVNTLMQIVFLRPSNNTVINMFTVNPKIYRRELLFGRLKWLNNMNTYKVYRRYRAYNSERNNKELKRT